MFDVEGLLSIHPSDQIHPRCRRADQSDAASGGFLTADISGLRCGGLPLTNRSWEGNLSILVKVKVLILH